MSQNFIEDESKKIDDSIAEYNIAIIPSQDGVEKLSGINSKLAEQLEPLGLENRHNKAHISLYHGAYKIQDLTKIADKLQYVAADTKKFRLFLENNLSVIGSNRYIEVKIKPFDLDVEEVKQCYEKIVYLHNKVVDTFSTYHQRPLLREKIKLEELKPLLKIKDETALKIALKIQTYGVSNIKEAFIPHITLWYQWPTNPAINDVSKKVEKNMENNFSFEAWAIAFGKLDFNGNIIGEEISNSSSRHLYAVFPIGEAFTLSQAKELAATINLDW